MPAKPCLKVFWLPGGPDRQIMGRGVIACNTPALQRWWDGKNTTARNWCFDNQCSAEMASGYIQQNTNKSRSEKMSISKQTT